MSKKTILIVAEEGRPDFLNIFRPLKDDFNFLFLLTEPKELNPNFEPGFGEKIYLTQFNSAASIARSLKPHKVIFFFLDTYLKVLMNMYFKKSGITTYFQEHGYRNNEIIKVVMAQKKPKGTSVKRPAATNSKIKEGLFVLNTLRHLPLSLTAIFFHYVKLMRQGYDYPTIISKLKKPGSARPDRYIVFSEENYMFYKHIHHLDEKIANADIIGIPQFDKYYKLLNEESEMEPKDFLFLDQEFGTLFGWDDNKKTSFLAEMANAVTQSGMKFWVKMHPRSKIKGLTNISGLHLVTDEMFEHLAKKTIWVSSFYSTLLIPFVISKKHIALTCNYHPDPPAYQPNTFLTKYNVAVSFDSVEGLQNLLTKDLSYFMKFKEVEWQRGIDKFIEMETGPVDGRSMSRLKNVLASD